MNSDRMKDLAPILEKDKRVKFAYLFGSRARGQAGPLSDTDDVFIHATAERYLHRSIECPVVDLEAIPAF